MTTRRSISVRIQGHEYRVRGDADEASVRRVAAFVDETMAKIRERTKTVDTLDLAVLAALNLANDLLALRDGAAAPSASAPPLELERVRSLLALIESVGVAAAEVG